MKRLLFIIFLLQILLLQAQENEFRQHVAYLASDSLQGRLAGSAGDSLAATYIRQELAAAGYQPLAENGWQSFSYTIGKSISGQSQQSAKKIYSRNVVMMLPAKKEPTEESIVIGAHFDHIGMGGKSSTSRKRDITAIHYGADDNASGVAMVLALAKDLAERKEQLRRNIVVVMFGAEEQGLIGAKHFVENPPKEAGKIVMMFNFDMVGRLDSTKLLQIHGAKTFVEAEELLNSAMLNHNELRFQFIGGGYGPSDHLAFYTAKIPVLYFTTGIHYDYHTPDDNIANINYQGMSAVFHFTKPLVLQIAKAEQSPTFREAGGSEQARTPERFKVTLGLVPDFNAVYEGPGMRADFITEGKPAHKAGLKNGDVIIEVNGVEIKNIDDYMQQLATLEAGVAIPVKVKRGEEILFFSVQL
ncbi:MAG: M20/M25/M40 family metallo-hydrolase [Bacteroidales bacterium]|nr:M20/M25/M40 family metallo-hydrolase [Bacteroidales bacterium]MCL2133011.1 M20/M25/M40 family metallo-hydrolase [Bacteroidales bacterium]